ncbi:T9SS type A sorting domain-containing protein, partial [candidate division KSB1 bacterium]|nr:T9SS type A sorting domain-containing protein [candidate division KSB1 bacterium]
SSGGGSLLTPSVTLTDSRGIASARWRLGNAGPQVLHASSEYLPGKSVQIGAQLAGNLPPVVQALTDTTVQVGQQLIFQLVVSDPENKPVSVNTENLPVGAQFDAVHTLQFRWSPTLDQIGDHRMTFIAADPNGGVTRVEVWIRVIAHNHAPEIVQYSPKQTELSYGFGQRLVFSVTAQDADGDPLDYRWILNDMPVLSGSDELVITTNPTLTFPLTVAVAVSDGVHSQVLTWTVYFATRVELSTFEAHQEGEDVRIVWRSAIENDTAGYRLSRALTFAGPFVALHSGWLLTNPLGEYEFLDTSARTADRFCYRLEALSRSGEIQSFDPISLVLALPQDNQLLQNYPNPFNPETTLRYQITSAQKVDIAIYNLSGRRVRTLVQGDVSAGYHSVVWDGRDHDGQTVPSGIYHAVLHGQSFRDVIKLLLIK